MDSFRIFGRISKICVRYISLEEIFSRAARSPQFRGSMRHFSSLFSGISGPFSKGMSELDTFL